MIIPKAWISGRELRSMWNRDCWFWQKWSAPAFYSELTRLRDAGVIQMESRQVIIIDADGAPVVINPTFVRAI